MSSAVVRLLFLEIGTLAAIPPDHDRHCDEQRRIRTGEDADEHRKREVEDGAIAEAEEREHCEERREGRDNRTGERHVDGAVAGNCEISFKGGIKTSHRATVGIAILKDYWNLGIGSAMFKELIAAARDRKMEIVELEFIKGNERARHLYEKFGFKAVCEKPNAFKLKDGTYQSEVYMQKYL